MKKLSALQKGRILHDIVEGLKDIEDKNFLFVRDCSDTMTLKIAKKAGITIDQGNRESGMVDISDDIMITYEWREDKAFKRLNDIKRNPYKSHHPFMDRFLNNSVSDELKELAKQFEEKNIPGSGPCSTWIGEIFRAIQRVQYRAHNDGDLPWDVCSPSFMSYIFVRSQIDLLNYSSSAYNENTCRYEFEFNDEFLKEHSWDGKISDVVEDELGRDLNITKYQLMELLSTGKIKDRENEFDSRDYKSLNQRESRYW